ncbi:MFS transporter [Frondihabitans cladoniiphilus]|uniref:MFS transporter n=1 Tax=Frondihabitans cladoniiphilus TaxID=715785 RepID=UPI0031E6D437
MPATTPRPTGIRRAEIGMPIALLGLFVALLPPIIETLAFKIRVLDPGNSAGALSLVLAIGAVCAMIMNPLAGRLSDRTRGRLGRRRPWILAGVVLGYGALLIIAFAQSVPMLLLGWALAQIFFNAAVSALLAIMADKVRPEHRGRVAAAVGVAQNGSQVAGVYLVQLFTSSVAQTLVPGTIGVAIVIVYAFVMNDEPLTEKAPRFTLKDFLGSFYFNPAKNPDFGWAWLTRFLMTASAATATNYLTYYLIVDFKNTTTEAATNVFHATLFYVIGIVITTFVAGAISDRIGRRKPFVLVAALIGVVGLSIIAFAPSIGVILLGELIMGAGIGSFYAVDLALITDVLPKDGNNAKDLGVVNIAQALPQSLVPVGAPAAVSAFGYPGLFISGAVVGLIGAVSVFRIKASR